MADMEKAVRRTRSDYEKLLTEQESSGLSLRAFAESRGVNVATFYGWHRRLRPKRAQHKKGGPALVPVRVVDPVTEATPACGPAPPQTFEVTIPGERVISVPVGFDAQELRRLLSVLDSSC